MKLLVINGPNLNMLGIREPKIYGSETLNDLIALLSAYCTSKQIEVDFFQSNHEGAIVDRIQEAYGNVDGIIINPAAYTHTSIAIPDAIKAVGLPAVEVHLSDISTREPYRQVSFTSEACIATIFGKHFQGYREAVDILHNHLLGKELLP
jgi:3-dehydroquinate dehydratase-2